MYKKMRTDLAGEIRWLAECRESKILEGQEQPYDIRQTRKPEIEPPFLGRGILRKHSRLALRQIKFLVFLFEVKRHLVLL